MTMEKQANEMKDTKVDHKSFGIRSILLTSWASVATALLLIILIGGTIYVNDVRSMCDVDNPDQIKTDRYEDDQDREDVYMDDQLKTQLFIRRNKDGAITLIADVDYNTKISTTYIAETDQCLLSAGEDLDWYQAWNAPKLNVSATERKHSISIYEEADPENRVTDMSLLPRYIRPFCQGKQIYWTKTTSYSVEPSELVRHKRGVAALDAPAPPADGWYCHYVNGFLCCHYIRCPR